jgi:hypothetical protein
VENVIDFDTLARTRMQAFPYPWASYSGPFRQPPPAQAFPDKGFVSHAEHRILDAIGKKRTDTWFQHNIETRALIELGAAEPHQVQDLDGIWLAIAQDILSARYRDCLSDVTGLDVRELKMQAHFWRCRGGSFFTPHVDKPHKVVTHLMYLTEDWTPAMGGCFRVLLSGDTNDVHAEVSPAKGQSILLRRTDTAWHSVTPTPRDSPCERRVLQVWFWGDP